MSAETWLAEYMPEPADSPEAQARPVSHCLRKWRGATRERLEKHGLFIMPALGWKDCALCIRHENQKGYADCRKCELAETLGHRCDHHDDAGNPIGPYSKYYEDGDPSAMIEALEKTLERYPDL